MSFSTRNLDRQKVIEKGKQNGFPVENFLAMELGISLSTYYRRMKFGWPKEGALALCKILNVADLKDLEDEKKDDSNAGNSL